MTSQRMGPVPDMAATQSTAPSKKGATPNTFPEAALRALLSGADWFSVRTGVAAMALAAQRYGYDRLQTSDPSSIDQPSSSMLPTEVTPESVWRCLENYFNSEILGRLKARQKVWLVRPALSELPGHGCERRVGPGLLGIAVPTSVVDHFAQQAHWRLLHDQLMVQVDQVLPKDGEDYSEGYRDAVQSMALTLRRGWVNDEQIMVAVQTALLDIDVSQRPAQEAVATPDLQGA